jgi:adenylate cyclase
MVGYVGIAEHMSLDHLPIFMNRYFEVIGTAIHSRNGTIDKYIGDVVEAFWWQPKGAQLACESALDQMQAMSEFHA